MQNTSKGWELISQEAAMDKLEERLFLKMYRV
jgi:hypothetical protein